MNILLIIITDCKQLKRIVYNSLTAQILVVPGELYNLFEWLMLSDGIYDTGVLPKGTSFKSPARLNFFTFDFLQQYNPDLPLILLVK
ncbi:MAG: hypothetical protein R2750_01400 [Bacteroidales bacterium]